MPCIQYTIRSHSKEHLLLIGSEPDGYEMTVNICYKQKIAALINPYQSVYVNKIADIMLVVE